MSGYSGRAEAIGHAGEVLQGAVRLGDAVEPFLVTLPAPLFQSAAAVRGANGWSVHPDWKTKALRAAQLACETWRQPSPLEIFIDSEIPVARGCGSSTADCVAVIRAVADMLGKPATDALSHEIAGLARLAETASDSTMFDCEPLAFLPRRGEVLRRFHFDWPAMHVSVVDLGGPAVDTIDCPMPTYSEDELNEFAWLLDELSNGHTAECIGWVASRSAAIHQRHRAHPAFDQLHKTAMKSGAFGVALAHSGTIAAVLSANPIAIQGAVHYRLEGVQHAHLAGRRR